MRRPVPISFNYSKNASQVSLHAQKPHWQAAQNNSHLTASMLPLNRSQLVNDTKVLTALENLTQNSEAILIWMFILLALALLIFMQLSGWPTAIVLRKQQYGGRAQELLLQDFEQLAQSLRGKVQKYSTSCMQQLGSRMLKDRFISVVPASSEGEGRFVQDWLKAELKWWESESVFNEGLPPRGSVMLENITNFFQEPEHTEHQACLTLLTKRHDEELRELRLFFPTPRTSSDFCNTLWQFFLKMQDAESSIKV